MEYSLVYYKTFDAIKRTSRFVSSCGGTRSGKTIANLQLIYQLALMDEGCLISIVSETFPHLKRGAIRDFPLAIGDLWDDRRWNISNSIYTLENGSQIEFFSSDSPSKVHGPARDHLFLNEVQNIQWEIARQLFVRTRGLIILDYNPTHEGWMQREIEPRPECVTIHSTYLDNRTPGDNGKSFLSPEQIREIEANQHDSNWWRVYGLGLVGSLEGLIYPNIELIDTMPDMNARLREIGGIDFGFNDPTSIVRVLADHGSKTAYIDQLAYSKAMKNADIAAVLNGQFNRASNIWADCEDTRAIAELSGMTGLKVRACDKSAPVRSEKRKFQLQWMQGWRLCITKRSLELIHDFRNYCFDKDADGNLLNTPIHDFSHGPDSVRYALFSEFAGSENMGNYVIGFNR